VSSVLKIVGLADGRPTPDDGRYVVWMDVDARAGRGLLHTTHDVREARVFDTLAQAARYWQRTSTVRPRRPDGQPNRPLTAYTIEIVPVTLSTIAGAIQ
jgi:hypothetical protein